MDELLRDFLTESAEQLGEVESLLLQFERTPADLSLITGIFRLVHTIKGTSGFIGLERLQAVAHVAETLLGRMRDGEPPTELGVSLVLKSVDHIRNLLVDIEQAGCEPPGDSRQIITMVERYLDRSISREGPDAVHEEPATPDPTAEQAAPAVIGQAARSQTEHVEQPEGTGAAAGPQAASGGAKGSLNHASETIRVTVSTIENLMRLVSELVLARNQLLELTRLSENDGLKLSLQRLSGLTSDLQDAVMRARMQPVSRLFANSPRLVRELSLDLGKRIDLVVEGGETELDRQLLEVIRDPLTHIIRNCADHGIEPPDERVAQGKSAHGEIKVRAFQEAGLFVIEIVDNGRGIDVQRVKAKAIAANLVREQDLAQMSEEEICRFIFEPGFSTASAVTSVSGRGVGMDVVRSNIESVRGTVGITSVYGKGTRLSLRIPLTLAIAPALIVEVAGQRFALPQHSVAEVIEARQGPGGTIKSVQGKLMLDLRGEVMPVAELPQLLGIDQPKSGDRKGVGGLIAVLRGSSAAVGLLLDAVIDVQEIVVKPLNRSLDQLDVFSGHTLLGDGTVLLILDPSGLARRVGIVAAGRPQGTMADTETRLETTRYVVFRAGAGVHKVLPTSVISRIENIPVDGLKRSRLGLVTQFQDRLIPVVELAAIDGMQAQSHPVIVMTVDGVTFGVLVEEIIDIVEDAAGIDISGGSSGTLATCRLKGEVIDMVDPVALLPGTDDRRSNTSTRPKRSVLFLASNSQSIDLITPFVQAAGYRVAIARSVNAARAMAASGEKIDVILMDIGSSDLDERELANVTELVGEIPVIGLTAGDHEDTVAALGHDRFSARLGRFDREGLLRALSDSAVKAA